MTTSPTPAGEGPADSPPSCDFCGRPRSKGGTLIRCATAAICDLCVDEAAAIVAARRSLSVVPPAANAEGAHVE